MGKYRKKVDNSRRLKYSDEDLARGVSWVFKNTYSVRKAAALAKIPFSTLRNRVNKLKREDQFPSDDIRVGKIGRKLALTTLEEKVLVDLLKICAEWGFPLTVNDVRTLVKEYLDISKRKVEQFQNNKLGKDWDFAFLNKRHPYLSARFSVNIKSSRADVCPEIITAYFTELEKTIRDIDPANIVNYDETCFIDDPGKLKTIVPRGVKAENILDHTKTSTSVMFAASAAGILLPPYICYKAATVQSTWIKGGPSGVRYNYSINGWFTKDIFDDWFQSIVVPYFRRLNGTKVVIGDNLCSHISLKTIQSAVKENIKFVLLPHNSTHLCQPLDVSVFRPIKAHCNEVLRSYKQKNKGVLPKCDFPLVLKSTIEAITNLSENIIAGFRVTGIVPLDAHAVLKRLPRLEENEATIGNNFVTPLAKLLNANRFSKKDGNKRRRRRKINTPAGKSVSLEDFEDGTRIAVKSNDDASDSGVVDKPNANEQSDAENSADNDDAMGERNEEQQDPNTHLERPEIGAFFSVQILTEQDHRLKKYIGQVTGVSNDTHIRMKFLRRRIGRESDYFVFPDVIDTSEIDRSSILGRMTVLSSRRGLYIFKENSTDHF